MGPKRKEKRATTQDFNRRTKGRPKCGLSDQKTLTLAQWKRIMVGDVVNKKVVPDYNKTMTALFALPLGQNITKQMWYPDKLGTLADSYNKRVEKGENPQTRQLLKGKSKVLQVGDRGRHYHFTVKQMGIAPVSLLGWINESGLDLPNGQNGSLSLAYTMNMTKKGGLKLNWVRTYLYQVIHMYFEPGGKLREKPLTNSVCGDFKPPWTQLQVMNYKTKDYSYSIEGKWPIRLRNDFEVVGAEKRESTYDLTQEAAGNSVKFAVFKTRAQEDKDKSDEQESDEEESDEEEGRVPLGAGQAIRSQKRANKEEKETRDIKEDKSRVQYPGNHVFLWSDLYTGGLIKLKDVDGVPTPTRQDVQLRPGVYNKMLHDFPSAWAKVIAIYNNKPSDKFLKDVVALAPAKYKEKAESKWSKLRLVTPANQEEANKDGVTTMDDPVFDGPVPTSKMTVKQWIDSEYHYATLPINYTRSTFEQRELYSPVCKRCLRVFLVPENWSSGVVKVRQEFGINVPDPKRKQSNPNAHLNNKWKQHVKNGLTREGGTDFVNLCSKCFKFLKDNNALLTQKSFFTTQGYLDLDKNLDLSLIPGDSVLLNVMTKTETTARVKDKSGFLSGAKVLIGGLEAATITEAPSIDDYEAAAGNLVLVRAKPTRWPIGTTIKVITTKKQTTTGRSLANNATKGQMNIVVHKMQDVRVGSVLSIGRKDFAKVTKVKLVDNKHSLTLELPLKFDHIKDRTMVTIHNPMDVAYKLEQAYRNYKMMPSHLAHVALVKALQAYEKANAVEKSMHTGPTKVKEVEIHVSDIETVIQKGQIKRTRDEVLLKEIALCEKLLQGQYTNIQGDLVLNPKAGTIRVYTILDALLTDMKAQMGVDPQQQIQKAIKYFDSTLVMPKPQNNPLSLTHPFIRGKRQMQPRKMRQSNLWITFVLHRRATDDDHSGHIIAQFHRAMTHFFNTDDELRKCIRFNKKVIVEKGQLKGLVNAGSGARRQREQKNNEFDPLDDTDNPFILDELNPYIGTIKGARKKTDPFDWKKDYDDDTYDEHIESIKVNGGVEIGPTNRLYHFHVMVSIVHWSRIMFDYFIMSNWFLDAFAKDGRFQILDQNGHPWIRESEAWYTQLKLYPQDDWDEVLRRYVRKQAVGSTISRNTRTV